MQQTTKPRRDWSKERTEMTRLLQETPGLTATQLAEKLGCTRAEVYRMGTVNSGHGLPAPAVNKRFRHKKSHAAKSIAGASSVPKFVGEEEVAADFFNAEPAGAVTAVVPRSSAKPLDVLQWLAGLTPAARKTATEVIRLAVGLSREELAAIAVVLRA